MTNATERLSELASWLDQSSADRRKGKPMFARNRARRRKDSEHVLTAAKGRFAELLPWDFNDRPTTDFHAHALPLFVSLKQAAGVKLPEVADLSEPLAQSRAYFRLEHLLFRMGDATLPQCAMFGLSGPEIAIADAIEFAGAGPTDLDDFPLLAVPLWAFSRKERAEMEARLPFIPAG